MNQWDPTGLCVNLFGVACLGGGSVTSSVGFGFNPSAGLQTLADLGAGIANGGARLVNNLPSTLCLGVLSVTSGCSWFQSEWSQYVNLSIPIPYQSCGWLGTFQAGEYSFGSAYGEVAPAVVGGEVLGNALANSAAAADNSALAGEPAWGPGTPAAGQPPDEPTIAEILKNKVGSIQRAPLPPGSPSWSEIVNMTLSEIRAGAQQNLAGYRTILKLLTDSRFNK